VRVIMIIRTITRMVYKLLERTKKWMDVSSWFCFCHLMKYLSVVENRYVLGVFFTVFSVIF